MLRNRLFILFAVVLIVLISGCTIGEVNTTPSEAMPSTSTDNLTNPTDNPNVSAPQGPPNSIQFSRLAGENPVVNETGFHYTGSIHAELNRVGDKDFNNVTLCLYDNQWNVIYSTELGTFTAGNRVVSVNIHTSEVPKRMIVEHPDFDNRSVFGGVLVRQDNQYVIIYRHELNRSPPSQRGNCR